jgi:hypothetical protein
MIVRRFAAILVLTGSMLAGCSDRDVVTQSYGTLAEASSAGAVERGWVPHGLPPSTQELREAHDTDSSRRWGLFNFAPAEGDHLRKLVVDGPPPELKCDIPARIEWWPRMLRGSISADQLMAAGLSAHRTTDGLNMVVNWKQGRAYYWKE